MPNEVNTKLVEMTPHQRSETNRLGVEIHKLADLIGEILPNTRKRAKVLTKLEEVALWIGTAVLEIEERATQV